jgi:hypothetical protein
LFNELKEASLGNIVKIAETRGFISEKKFSSPKENKRLDASIKEKIAVKYKNIDYKNLVDFASEE